MKKTIKEPQRLKLAMRSSEYMEDKELLHSPRFLKSRKNKHNFMVVCCCSCISRIHKGMLNLPHQTKRCFSHFAHFLWGSISLDAVAHFLVTAANDPFLVRSLATMHHLWHGCFNIRLVGLAWQCCHLCNNIPCFSILLHS